MAKIPAKLALEDGTVYAGTAFGARGTRCGELVFNTSMSGYQEILTDPSYAGQIVTMTYPLIGNYGVNSEDVESDRPWVEGFVVRELSSRASNFRAEQDLYAYLIEHGIIGIEGVDTRAITRRIRIQGAMRAVISTEIFDEAELVRRAVESPSMAGRDLVQLVCPKQPYTWSEPLSRLGRRLDGQAGRTAETTAERRDQPDRRERRLKVVAFDCGMKRNICRHMVEQGLDLTVVPPFEPAERVLQRRPDGLFLSNGPGDPEPVAYLQQTVRKLIGKVPIFGICLGHQILALALGARTYKLKFGHHGGNQPVMNLTTRKVEITAQNHGFAVEQTSLQRAGAIVSHINLNDQTVEGFTHSQLPLFAVQYHPEASPGPHDANYLFGLFKEMMLNCRPLRAELL